MPFISYVYERHLTLLHSAILGMVQTKELWSKHYMAFVQTMVVEYKTELTSPQPGSCQKSSSCLCLHGTHTTFCPLSLPKEVLLRTRILLVALHMWCLPPSAVCRGMSATVTLIPGKLLVRSWLNYNMNLLNVNTNHLPLRVAWYIPTKHIYFPCMFFAILHVLLALMFIHCRYKIYSWISLQISHCTVNNYFSLNLDKYTPYEENISTQNVELNEICIFKISWWLNAINLLGWSPMSCSS